MPRAVVVQHVEVEGPVRIATALAEAGVEVDVVRADRGDPIPTGVDGIDGLVVMGGPMSARSDDGFPSRRAEIDLLAAAVEAVVPTLGVCLGSQLLAAAGGATVESGTGLEVGWGTVDLTEESVIDPLFVGLGPELSVLHWHGETFTLPTGAVRLAGNARYRNQAFRLGSAWGLQFHLEVDQPAVDRFVAAFGAEADDPEAISEMAPAWLARGALVQATVLSRFAALVAD